MVNLGQLVASATHLLEGEVEARHGHDVHAASAVRPVCTEPYCGGFWWAQPKPAVPKIDGELGKAAKREKESNPVPVDFPDVSYYPAFDPPIASKVHLLRANKGYYDRWNVPHAVTVTVETPSDLKFLANEVLNNFMRVQEDAGLGHPERVVRQGLQLISWKSMQGGGRLHVTPFLGSKKELLSSSLPVKLTFGGKPTVPKEGGRLFGEFRERCEPGDLPQRPIFVPVKRLDFVLHRRKKVRHPMFGDAPVPEEVQLHHDLVEINDLDKSDRAAHPGQGPVAAAIPEDLLQGISDMLFSIALEQNCDSGVKRGAYALELQPIQKLSTVANQASRATKIGKNVVAVVVVVVVAAADTDKNLAGAGGVPALIFLGVWFMVLNQIVRIVWQERFREAEYSLEALQRFLVDWDTARCGHVVGVVVSIGGMLIFALLLSLITSSFEEFLWHLRHGSIPVVEGDHIVILGYDSSAVIMIEEPRGGNQI
ncbi:hypothetical protein AK812_SmicGene8260 [Symbiodinium microadriaticum]|uniref:Uncharacterized protein n=1 Tax=Symbiodinium microadriaticum TaxID=2951 RepID=A0A1Q9ELE8_SYMMI|nr:hypothetical protein AK812_SmicGene8260 [Symbiodinium microadriaticum]